MQPIPPAIQKTFQQRKNQEKTRIELRHINNRYYIYKTTSTYNKQKTPKKRPTWQNHTRRPIPPKNTKNKHHNHQNIRIRKLRTPTATLKRPPRCHTKPPPPKRTLSPLHHTHPKPQPHPSHPTHMGRHLTSTKLKANLTPTNITTTLNAIGHMVQETYDLFAKLTPEGG